MDSLKISSIESTSAYRYQQHHHKAPSTHEKKSISTEEGGTLLSVVPCGYWFIMDNASFHKKKKLRSIAERYGVNLLFLPSYSPDLNPIEKFWANLKIWLRKNVAEFTALRLAILNYCVRFLY